MSFKRVIGFVVLAACVSSLMMACKVGETTYATVTTPFRAKKETRTCDSPFAKVDTGTLKACGGDVDKGHCYDATKVPIPASELTPDPACTADEVCMPDSILTANGTKVKSCKFFIGDAPGACTSLLVSQVNAHKDQLKQDVCDATERCAPCIDPTSGTDTHICDEVGAYTEPCTGGVDDSGSDCCHGAGLCSKKSGVPADNQDDLSQDVCPEEQLCLPAAMVDGNPVKCDVLGVPGVCLDVCFAQMLRGASQVLKGGCGPTEVCLPCAIGKGQGMPGC